MGGAEKARGKRGPEAGGRSGVVAAGAAEQRQRHDTRVTM